MPPRTNNHCGHRYEASPRRASSPRGRCSAAAYAHSARSQTSASSAAVSKTGIALGCTATTIALGSHVRKP